MLADARQRRRPGAASSRRSKGFRSTPTMRALEERARARRARRDRGHARRARSPATKVCGERLRAIRDDARTESAQRELEELKRQYLPQALPETSVAPAAALPVAEPRGVLIPVL